MEALLGAPCPGTCRKLEAPDPGLVWDLTMAYGDVRKQAHCPYSWGHCQSLPEALVKDPCSLKARHVSCKQVWTLWRAPTVCCCLQVPELRAACKSLGIKSTGKLSHAVLLQFTPSSSTQTAAAGTKAELQVTILARFGLTSPASASHKLVFLHKMQDTILAGWVEELAMGQYDTRTAAEQACNDMVQASSTANPFFTAWTFSPPLDLGPSVYFREQFRAVSATGKDQLAQEFGSWSDMQAAVLQRRKAAEAAE